MNIVIIDTVSSGISYFSAAEKLKVGLYVFSSGKEDFFPKHSIKEVININTHDFNSQLSKIIELGNINAVIPGVEYAVQMASSLGKASGKNFLNIETAEIVRNKFLFRDRLNEKNLNNIKYYEIKFREKFDITNKINFPVVVKPVDMAGSMRVIKVENYEELTSVIENIWNSLPEDVGFLSSGNLIVEEYILGDEFSVEGIVHKNGNISIISITEKILGPEPYFIEMGHIVGQSYNEDFRSKIKSYTEDVLSAINMNIGPFHLELRVTNLGQPVAIELAARLPGDNIVELIKLATGVDLAMANLCEYLNIDYDIKHTSSNVSAIAFVSRGEKQTFRGISGLTEFSDYPEYVNSHVYFNEGELLGSEQDWTSRVGYAIFSGENKDTIKNLVKSVHENVRVI